MENNEGWIVRNSINPADTLQQNDIAGKRRSSNILSHMSFGVEWWHRIPGAAHMSITPANAETYISVDVETAGPNPSQYSLLAIGASCVFFPERNFYIELKPVNLNFQPEALESCGFSLEKLVLEGVEAAESMRRFETWLQTVLPAGGQAVFVGFNAPFDWMFVNDYFHRFLGHNPFGYAAIDIKSYYMGLAKVPWEETTMRFLGRRYLNQPVLIHHALRDAIDQGGIFRELILEAAGQQDKPAP
jgi:DNA polymerase III epsilon subunit-like protein